MKTKTALIIGGVAIAAALVYMHFRSKSVAPPTAGGGGGTLSTAGGVLDAVQGFFSKIGAERGADTGTKLATAPGDYIAGATAGIPVVGSITGGVAKGADWVANKLNPFSW